MKALTTFLILLILGASSAMAFTHVESNSSMNYWVHFPEGYKPTGQGFPLLVFLHGLGEKGDGKDTTANFNMVTMHGPGNLIKKNKWDKSLPFIVVMPQLSKGVGGWGTHSLDVIAHVKANFNVDHNRVYVTGLSLGGHGTFIAGREGADQIAAILPIAGGEGVSCAMVNMGVWGFHGDADNTVKVNRGIVPIEKINKCNPPPSPLAKITIYPGVGHNSWTRTYDNNHGDSNIGGDGQVYTDIYRWLLSFSLDKSNTPPSNSAPSISPVTAQSVEEEKIKRINVSASDPDGDSITLSLQSAPNFVGLTDNGDGTGQIEIAPGSGKSGNYTVKVQAKDPSGATSSISFSVTVTAAPAPVDGEYGAGLTYKHYHHSGWGSIPDLSTLTPVKQGVTSVISLDERTIDDRFAFSFEGYLRIDVAGTYTFSLASDDGSNLYLDDVRLIDNDGAHALKKVSKSISLSPGLKKFRVDYFDNNGSEILEVTYSGPGFAEREIPASAFFYDVGGQAPGPIPPADTTAPVITLNGASKITLKVGEQFTDPGAKAIDNVDGDISSQITKSGSVDTSKVGTYTIRYNVKDAAGNAANEVSRTVVIEAAPVVSGQKMIIDVGGVGNQDSNVNNITGQGHTITLKDVKGAVTNVKVLVDDFNGVNNNGTTSPASALGFSAKISADSFFGNDKTFQNQIKPKGIVRISNLDKNATYNISFFASRMNVNNNRQTKYTVRGASQKVVYLDVHNNTSKIAVADGIKPNSNGQIIVDVEKGPNNNDGTGFFYLGGMIIEGNGDSSPVPIDPPQASDQKIVVDVGGVGNQDSQVNNITNQGQTITLKDVEGKNTNIKMFVNDFNGVNNDGTKSPAMALGLSSQITADSFFGNDKTFQNQIKPKGHVRISNLDKNKVYKISFFASRMNANNNRQTQYTVKGATQKTVYLDVHENTSKSAVADGIKPDANGQINVEVEKGPNNNNGTGFFYLGGMIIESSN